MSYEKGFIKKKWEGMGGEGPNTSLIPTGQQITSPLVYKYKYHLLIIENIMSSYVKRGFFFILAQLIKKFIE